MATKKKNSNYVTEKTVAAKEAKAAAKRKAKIKKIVIESVAAFLTVAIIVGAVFAIGVPLGMLDYKPKATAEFHVEIEGYDDDIVIELYGNDAPKTVDNFTKLIKDSFFNGTTLHTLTDNRLYFGSQTADFGENGISGEFKENKIVFRKGVIAMSRGEGDNSGKEQFFIVTKNSTELNGQYAAFARIVKGISVIESIVKNAEVDENGKIINAPKIVSVSTPHEPGIDH